MSTSRHDVLKILASDHWFLALIWRGGDLPSSLLPYPAHTLSGGKIKRSNKALTLALLGAAASTALELPLDSAWFANSILAGVGLVVGIVALGASVPGSNLFRLAIRRSPASVLAHMFPYAWALLLAGVGMIATLPLHSEAAWARALATGLVLFGLLSLAQVVLHSLRVYALGLLALHDSQQDQLDALEHHLLAVSRDLDKLTPSDPALQERINVAVQAVQEFRSG